MKIKFKIWNIVNLFLLAMLLSITAIFVIDWWVTYDAKTDVFDSISDIPARGVGLLLGASKILDNGQMNLYYKYRIEAATKLYKAGKIKFIIASGDNSRKDYNEAMKMTKDLIAKGIPANKIFADYAGFRTLDSVIRSKEIFGQQQITIISQAFHNERAIFIAKHYGISAIGFNAQDVTGYNSLRTKLREKLARVKLMLDLIFAKQPKFLGDKIRIQ